MLSDLFKYINPDNHTLTWLIYQSLLKFNVKYGLSASVVLNDFIQVLNNDYYRFIIDLSILTWLFFHSWQTKELIIYAANSKEVLVPPNRVGGTKPFIISAILAFFLLKLSLNFTPWVIIIFIISMIFISKLVSTFLSVLWYKHIRWAVILFIIYNLINNYRR